MKRIQNRTVLVLLAMAQFIMVLDTTVMNVSISQVVDDLDTSVTGVQLAITAYTLVMAAFMLTGAKLGDIWGRRRAFAIGLGIYGVGSLTTALSPNLGVLLVGWSLIEGLGAALVIPAIAALTASTYTGSARALAFGLLGGVAGAGAAVGPLIGGFVTTALTWRVVFAAETLVVIVVILFVRRMPAALPKTRPDLDVVGAVLSALGLGLTVFGILKISSWGLFQPTGALTIGGTEITPFGLSVVPFLVLAGLVVLGGFARWEERVARAGGTPLLRADLLRVPQMRAGLSMVLSQYLILAGTFFVIPLYLQLVLGKDALHTGLKILPISVAMMITALSGPRLATRMSPRRVVQIGLGLLLVSILGLMATISDTLASVAFAVSLAGFGGGIGLVISQLGNVVMSSVPGSRSSEAGGVQGAAQNLGQSLGTALIGAVLLTSLTTGFQDSVRADPSIPQRVQQKIASSTEQGLAMVSRSDARSIAEEAGLPPNEVDTVVDHYGDAQISGLKRALLAASTFVLVGLWFARALPGEALGGASEGAAAGPRPATPRTAAAGAP
ncbi:MAG TPA: MFS transporter [Thermoleophilaceae bacterium]|nr:MFS transporter [Thermoleophilaceae bacterium]